MPRIIYASADPDFWDTLISLALAGEEDEEEEDTGTKEEAPPPKARG